MKKLLIAVLLLMVTGAAYPQKVTTLSYIDTVAVNTDTVSRHITTTSNNINSLVKQNYTVTIAADDTLEVSFTSAFTESIVILPDESYTNPRPYNVNFQSNMYIRRKGTAGTVTYRLFLVGD